MLTRRFPGPREWWLLSSMQD